MDKKIALLAFEGGLPRAILESDYVKTKDILVVSFDEFPASISSNRSFSLGKVGALFDYLRTHDVTSICLAGRIVRPDLWKLRFDITGLKIAFSLLGAFRKGDDNLLRTVLTCFETYGFEPLSVADLCPDLVMPIGCITKKNTPNRATIDYGKNILGGIAPYDIGQSIALCDNVILAVEALEGTDAMILRASDIPDKRRKNLSPPILIKAMKKGQTRKADLPAFGIQTVENLYKAGFSGAALEAGSVLLIDGQKVIEKADEYGLFLVGF